MHRHDSHPQWHIACSQGPGGTDAQVSHGVLPVDNLLVAAHHRLVRSDGGLVQQGGQCAPQHIWERMGSVEWAGVVVTGFMGLLRQVGGHYMHTYCTYAIVSMDYLINTILL